MRLKLCKITYKASVLGIILETFWRKVFRANNRRTCWRPFISPPSNEVHPFLPSFYCVGWAFIPKWYLVQECIIFLVCSIRTPVNNASFRHFSTKNYGDTCIRNTTRLVTVKIGSMVSRYICLSTIIPSKSLTSPSPAPPFNVGFDVWVSMANTNMWQPRLNIE